MKLFEYQAKELFAQAGIAVPPGNVAATPEEAVDAARAIGGNVVVKAQVHMGGRGKAGFIKVAESPAQAAELARTMLGAQHRGLTIHRVYVEQAIEIVREYYLSAIIDRDNRRIAMILSAMGGMDIEEVAATAPEKIVYLHPNPWRGPLDFEIRTFVAAAGLDRASTRDVAKIVRQVFAVMMENDASLVEINPLAVTAEGKVIAADGKFEIDDNALFRHPSAQKYQDVTEDDEFEAEAHRRGLTYVHLDGNVGIIGNGAGLVMNTLDVVAAHGGKPANFLDVGGGAKADLVRNAMDMVLQDTKVEGILINIFGGVTRCDEVAKGVIDAMESLHISVPLVVRMAGTRVEEGQALLREAHITPVNSAAEGADGILSKIHKG
jgi:succinyl-CoA synthetase beta subunit